MIPYATFSHLIYSLAWSGDPGAGGPSRAIHVGPAICSSSPVVPAPKVGSPAREPLRGQVLRKPGRAPPFRRLILRLADGEKSLVQRSGRCRGSVCRRSALRPLSSLELRQSAFARRSQDTNTRLAIRRGCQKGNIDYKYVLVHAIMPLHHLTQ